MNNQIFFENIYLQIFSHSSHQARQLRRHGIKVEQGNDILFLLYLTVYLITDLINLQLEVWKTRLSLCGLC